MNIELSELAELLQQPPPLRSIERKSEHIPGQQIVVLDRGWVFVGEVAIEGDNVAISEAQNVRYWGTTKGLGELAQNGPTDKTKLDPAGRVVAPRRAVIFMLQCQKEF